MTPRFLRTILAIALPLCFASLNVVAQPVAATLLPMPAPIAKPGPQTQAYPGVLTLSVDATDVTRHIFRIRETIPVSGPGPLTLSLPKWIPGEHAPSGPIALLAGLIITANGQRLEWQRDVAEMTAFHVQVPAGVKEISLELTQQAPGSAAFSGVTVTPDILVLKWSALALYPAGYAVSNIRIQPSVRLPKGWGHAVALDGGVTEGDLTRFAPTSFETLVDSPLYAGRHTRTYDLDPGASVPVRLNVFADDEANLSANDVQIAAHRQLVQQAYKLFGAHHYDHYDFLLSLNKEMGFVGIEHHRSSENGYFPKYFSDWDAMVSGRDLLPHEYTHSWNGKFRRPADQWTPDYTTPMRDSLLWVYEGQTQYWGQVLASRSGLLNREQTLEKIAMSAARLDATPGRIWRNLQDTTNGEILGSRSLSGSSSPSWIRGVDYYDEGALIWLDADTLIREKTGGKKSLDDFAKAFFGIANGSYTPATYQFADVVAGLNAVYPFDWTNFLRSRLDGHGPGAPLDGLARGGYKLVFSDVEGPVHKAADGMRKSTHLMHSVGLTFNKDSEVTDIQWEGPAFKAGLTTGATLIAVNGLPFDADILKDAIKMAKTGNAGANNAIELLVKADGRFKTLKLDYHGGLRYPKLERVGNGPALLDDILRARS